FARPGQTCRHNLNYWTFGDYLGIGAGAHGKLTLHDGKAWKMRRQTRWQQPRRYLNETAAGKPVQEEFPVTADDLPCEFMMNALRLNEGFAAGLFEARTGRALTTVETMLRQAEDAGLLVRDASRIAPTRQGQRFLNRLLEMFLT
ncbi:MAG: oxygen-independent coproporphyrinogen III oxidase-like protein, partial [Candidatus Accumulibacter sp.]|nr:oxygen-independent coproporphyrinogen III oxidase-like protein [Accumulibacter sp.]